MIESVEPNDPSIESLACIIIGPEKGHHHGNLNYKWQKMIEKCTGLIDIAQPSQYRCNVDIKKIPFCTLSIPYCRSSGVRRIDMALLDHYIKSLMYGVRSIQMCDGFEE